MPLAEPVTARRRFGELEADVLAALWSLPEPMVPAEVQAAVGGDLAYTTVMTILVRLHDKGVIQPEKLGCACTPIVPWVEDTTVVADQVRRLLDRGNDRTAAPQGLIDGLDPADAEVLGYMLAAAGRKRRNGQ